MADATSDLSIVLRLVDEASAALQGVSAKTRASLEEIQSKADQVRNTFGLMGGAIIGGLGVLVTAAANNITAETQLTTAIKAGIAAAQDDTASTSLLAKQKELLQSQLDGLNGKIDEYKDKIAAGKDANGAYAAGLDTLQQKVSAVQDKLATLSNEQKLATQSTEQIVKQFDAAAKAGTDYGFANDDTIKSLTLLFRALGDTNQSLKANQEAMDLARARGIDLSTASTLIIQAMEGNARALKQFGINLKDGLTPAEALNELQIKLAGSAKDYVNTPWGQLDVAKAKAGALAETLGADLIPILTRLLEAITPMIERFTAFAEAHPKLVTNVLIAIGVLGALFIAIAAIATVISSAISIFLAFSTLMSAVVPIIAAVGAVIAAVGGPVILLGLLIGALAFFVITHWTEIKEGTVIAWNAISSFVTAHWQDILNVLMPGMGFLAKFIFDHWSQIQDGITNVWNAIKAVIQAAVDSITDIVNGLFDSIKKTVDNIIATINSVKNAASSVASAAGGVATGAIHAIVPHFAAGGIVTGPTIGLIGEAGPEAIIPLSQLGGVGGSNINITITGNTISSQLDVRGIAQAVGAEIVRSLRMNQKISV